MVAAAFPPLRSGFSHTIGIYKISTPKAKVSVIYAQSVALFDSEHSLGNQAWLQQPKFTHRTALSPLLAVSQG